MKNNPIENPKKQRSTLAIVLASIAITILALEIIFLIFRPIKERPVIPLDYLALVTFAVFMIAIPTRYPFNTRLSFVDLPGIAKICVIVAGWAFSIKAVYFLTCLAALIWKKIING